MRVYNTVVVNIKMWKYMRIFERNLVYIENLGKVLKNNVIFNLRIEERVGIIK